MYCLFDNCIKFKGEGLENWDVSNVVNMNTMFMWSKFTGENGDISNWDVSNVTDMEAMFAYSKFTAKNGDISNWNVSNVKNMKYMFTGTSLGKNSPKWYKN